MENNLLSTRDVLSLLGGVTQVTLWRLRRRHGFPAPFRLTPNKNAYRRDDVEAWIESRQQIRT